ncbi:MAG: 7 transmembrane receptor, partial [Cytophagales bacterium]|nr:7 transmembrane receptor [Cytophagales bacterium]
SDYLYHWEYFNHFLYLCDMELHSIQRCTSVSFQDNTVLEYYRSFEVFRCVFLLFCLSNLFFYSSCVLVIGSMTREWSVSGGEETQPEYAFCLLVGVLVEFFQLAGIFWTFCIAHTLFMVLTVKDYNPERFEVFYHILCWAVPLIFDVILIITKSIGDSGLWYVTQAAGFIVYSNLCK